MIGLKVTGISMTRSVFYIINLKKSLITPITNVKTIDNNSNNILLCILGEFSGGGSVAVAVRVSDM